MVVRPCQAMENIILSLLIKKMLLLLNHPNSSPYHLRVLLFSFNLLKLWDVALEEEEFPLTPIGVLASGSVHARFSARRPIDMSRIFLAHMFVSYEPMKMHDEQN